VSGWTRAGGWPTRMQSGTTAMWRFRTVLMTSDVAHDIGIDHNGAGQGQRGGGENETTRASRHRGLIFATGSQRSSSSRRLQGRNSTGTPAKGLVPAAGPFLGVPKGRLRVFTAAPRKRGRGSPSRHFPPTSWWWFSWWQGGLMKPQCQPGQAEGRTGQPSPVPARAVSLGGDRRTTKSLDSNMRDDRSLCPRAI